MYLSYRSYRYRSYAHPPPNSACICTLSEVDSRTIRHTPPFHHDRVTPLRQSWDVSRAHRIAHPRSSHASDHADVCGVSTGGFGTGMIFFGRHCLNAADSFQSLSALTGSPMRKA